MQQTHLILQRYHQGIFKLQHLKLLFPEVEYGGHQQVQKLNQLHVGIFMAVLRMYRNLTIQKSLEWLSDV